MKFLARLKMPTPKKWRKIGNLLVTFGSAGALAEYNLLHDKFLATLFFSIGLLGKIITSLMVEDENV